MLKTLNKQEEGDFLNMIKSFYENAQLTSYFMVNDYQLKPEEDMKGIRMERTCR